MRTFNTLMLIKLLSRSSDFPTNIQDEKGNQKEPKRRPRGQNQATDHWEILTIKVQ